MRLRLIATAAALAVVLLPVAVGHAQDYAEHYVVDAFGGVHAGGGAPVISPATPYFGFDVAAAIQHVAVGTNAAVGDGYILLDKFGGVHHGGALAADPPSGGTPYFGFDAARSITLRQAPSRISHAGSAAVTQLFTASATFNTVISTSITVPIDGWLHITGNASVTCTSGNGLDLVVWLSANVDAITDGVPSAQGAATWSDCVAVGGLSPRHNVQVSTVKPVAAGPHVVNLLARKVEGTGVGNVWGSVTAEFIALDGGGQLSRAETVVAPRADTSLLAPAQNHAQHYVLDAFGGVHAGGGAPVLSPATPYFGFDVAAAIEYLTVDTGEGYVVLDKFGGGHKGGALSGYSVAGTPYFGFDAARSISLRDAPSRISSAVVSSPASITNSVPAFTTVASTSIIAPINGWLHVTGTSNMGCLGSAGDQLVSILAVNVDAATPSPASAFVNWQDCAPVGSQSPTQGQTVSWVTPVTAGPHTVNLLARKESGAGWLFLLGRSLTAKFVARGPDGQLSAPLIIQEAP